jgi:hypothetical protein
VVKIVHFYVVWFLHRKKKYREVNTQRMMECGLKSSEEKENCLLQSFPLIIKVADNLGQQEFGESTSA